MCKPWLSASQNSQLAPGHRSTEHRAQDTRQDRGQSTADEESGREQGVMCLREATQDKGDRKHPALSPMLGSVARPPAPCPAVRAGDPQRAGVCGGQVDVLSSRL